VADTFWRIDFAGEAYREAELTIDQVERIERRLKTTWRSINPLRSAGDAKGVLAVLIADRTNVSEDEAAKQVGALRVTEFMEMVSVEADDVPAAGDDVDPSGAAGSSTPS
jgi:hypothetical protein